MAKKVSSLFGRFLKSVLGRNSPVKSTMRVESMVSAGTVNPGDMPLNNVASKSFAIRIPYTTSAMLFPTSMVLTKLFGCL